MADIINLRLFKKRKSRENCEKQAAVHRHKFGKTKLEKSFDKRQKEKQENFLQDNFLTPNDEP